MAGDLEQLIDRHRPASAGPSRPSWSESSVWLIAYADHFPVADTPPLAALDGFISDELTDIVDGVHILPFAPWSSDGGFAVIDYEAVDDRYGSWADVERITAQRTVMFDAVINHMSAESPWFQGFLAGDPAHEGFFRTSDPAVDTSRVVRPRTSPLLTPFTTATGETVHVWTTFSADQVDLDYANPAVLLRILRVLAAYCHHGADAIRLDAIGFMWKDEATTSIHLPQTHQLIQIMRSFVDEISPGTILISETNVPHAENISYLGEPGTDEVHAVYQFPLAPLVAHAALSGDTEVLCRWAAGIDAITGPGRSFLNFLACHDGIGVRPAEGLLDRDQLAVLIDACRANGGLVGERSLPDGSTSPYELNTTWFDLMRGSDGVDEQTTIQRHLATHALMLSLPGIGAVYAHAALGASNDLDAVTRSGHARDINRTPFTDREGLVRDLRTPGTRAAVVSSGLAELVARRRSSRAFHPAGSMQVLEGPPGVFAVDRSHDGERARVIVNLGADRADLGSLVADATELVTGATPAPTLASYDSLWLAV